MEPTAGEKRKRREEGASDSKSSNQQLQRSSLEGVSQRNSIGRAHPLPNGRHYTRSTPEPRLAGTAAASSSGHGPSAPSLASLPSRSASKQLSNSRSALAKREANGEDEPIIVAASCPSVPSADNDVVVLSDTRTSARSGGVIQLDDDGDNEDDADDDSCSDVNSTKGQRPGGTLHRTPLDRSSSSSSSAAAPRGKAVTVGVVMDSDDEQEAETAAISSSSAVVSARPAADQIVIDDEEDTQGESAVEDDGNDEPLLEEPSIESHFPPTSRVGARITVSVQAIPLPSPSGSSSSSSSSSFSSSSPAAMAGACRVLSADLAGCSSVGASSSASSCVSSNDSTLQYPGLLCLFNLMALRSPDASSSSADKPQRTDHITVSAFSSSKAIDFAADSAVTSAAASSVPRSASSNEAVSETDARGGPARSNSSSSSDDNEDADDNICAICRDAIDSPASRGHLGYPGCTHAYHWSCIGQWARVTNSCPLCKMQFGRLARVGVESAASSSGITSRDTLGIDAFCSSSSSSSFAALAQPSADVAAKRRSSLFSLVAGRLHTLSSTHAAAAAGHSGSNGSAVNAASSSAASNSLMSLAAKAAPALKPLAIPSPSLVSATATVADEEFASSSTSTAAATAAFRVTILSEVSIPSKAQSWQPTEEDLAALGYSASDLEARCRVCNSDAHEERLLLCDGHCGTSAHTDCIGLAGVPDGDWYCNHCVEDGTAPDDYQPPVLSSLQSRGRLSRSANSRGGRVRSRSRSGSVELISSDAGAASAGSSGGGRRLRRLRRAGQRAASVSDDGDATDDDRNDENDEDDGRGDVGAFPGVGHRLRDGAAAATATSTARYPLRSRGSHARTLQSARQKQRDIAIQMMVNQVSSRIGQPRQGGGRSRGFRIVQGTTSAGAAPQTIPRRQQQRSFPGSGYTLGFSSSSSSAAGADADNWRRRVDQVNASSSYAFSTTPASSSGPSLLRLSAGRDGRPVHVSQRPMNLATSSLASAAVSAVEDEVAAAGSYVSRRSSGGGGSKTATAVDYAQLYQTPAASSSFLSASSMAKKKKSPSDEVDLTGVLGDWGDEEDDDDHEDGDGNDSTEGAQSSVKKGNNDNNDLSDYGVYDYSDEELPPPVVSEEKAGKALAAAKSKSFGLGGGASKTSTAPFSSSVSTKQSSAASQLAAGGIRGSPSQRRTLTGNRFQPVAFGGGPSSAASSSSAAAAVLGPSKSVAALLGNVKSTWLPAPSRPAAPAATSLAASSSALFASSSSMPPPPGSSTSPAVTFSGVLAPLSLQPWPSQGSAASAVVASPTSNSQQQRPKAGSSGSSGASGLLSPGRLPPSPTGQSSLETLQRPPQSPLASAPASAAPEEADPPSSASSHLPLLAPSFGALSPEAELPPDQRQRQSKHGGSSSGSENSRPWEETEVSSSSGGKKHKHRQHHNQDDVSSSRHSKHSREQQAAANSSAAENAPPRGARNTSDHSSSELSAQADLLKQLVRSFLPELLKETHGVRISSSDAPPGKAGAVPSAFSSSSDAAAVAQPCSSFSESASSSAGKTLSKEEYKALARAVVAQLLGAVERGRLQLPLVKPGAGGGGSDINESGGKERAQRSRALRLSTAAKQAAESYAARELQKRGLA